MKRLLLSSSVLAILLGLSAMVAAQRYHAFLETPLTLDGPITLDVPKGATMGRVLAQLERRGATQRDWRWQVFNRLHPVTIMAGEYALGPGLRPAELADLLERGRVITYAFTIVEGWTFKRLTEALDEEQRLAHERVGLGDDHALMARLGLPDMHPEGWFLPETYHYVRGDSDLAILERAHQAMRAALEETWAQRADIPLSSSYELLTLASIVEKETGLAEERAQVAGVFTRRLLKGWRLETDPTVIYGLGEAFDGDIRTRDLRTDTPYNTYTRHGLPPTPIALPGKAALQATARPATGSAMFFVADGQGGHVFSDTLEQHNAAVRRMLKGNQ